MVSRLRDEGLSSERLLWPTKGPSRFEEELGPEEIERAREEWRGNPEVIAAHFGVSAHVIRPYLAYQDDMPRQRTQSRFQEGLQWLGVTKWKPSYETIKAFPEDEHDLGDTWVFIDFWRRLGIVYPEDAGSSDKRLRIPAEVLQYTLLRAEQGSE